MAEPERYPRLKIIENGRVSPPLNSVPASSSLPLNLFDIPWMLNFLAQFVSFYEFPVPNSYFTQTIVPALKSSLSIALKQFYPLAGKLVVPPPPDKPRVLYKEGDSVLFTVAESMEDFRELISNDPQDVKLLHPLVPQLPPWDVSDEGICNRAPLLAIQVTLFPNSGMCLGIQFNHADGRSFQHFMKSWASICQTGDLHSSLVPFLDRRIIKDPNDVQTTLLKSLWSSEVASFHGLPPLCTDQRVTFVVSRATINRLNSWISKQSTILSLQPMHISRFAAACAFTWVCIVKSTYDHEGDNDNKPQLSGFVCVADCRNRLETPVPETYFGNCLVPCAVDMEKKVLLGRDGIVLAARAIAQKIKELEKCGGGGACILQWAEKCFNESYVPRSSGDLLAVTGSPQLDFYDADFGWGRPKKFVMVHIDREMYISLVKSRDETGAMEIGVALTKASMAAFISLFTQLESFIIDSDSRPKL